jgi:hypothetical protein
MSRGQRNGSPRSLIRFSWPESSHHIKNSVILTNISVTLHQYVFINSLPFPKDNNNVRVWPCVCLRKTFWSDPWVIKILFEEKPPRHDAINLLSKTQKIRDSIVGIATSYGLDDRRVWVRALIWSRIFSSPRRPERFWGSPSLLANGYRRLFPRGKAAGAWSWPIISNYFRGQENVDLYVHSPYAFME